MSDTDDAPTLDAGPFGIRLDPATLDRLDRFAARIGRKRAGAAAVVIAAGLDALQRIPVLPPRRATVDVDELAAALAESIQANRHTHFDVDTLADALIDRLPPPRVTRADPPSPDTIAAGIVLAMRDPATRAAIVAELAAVVGDGTRTRESPPPPPADGPRIDPATLRGVGGERRRARPERRADGPGRRLGDDLRACRRARGLSQLDAAAAARVSPSTYHRAERGDDVSAATRAALMTWIGDPS